MAWGVAGALAATAATGLLFGAALTGRELARGLALPSLTHLTGMVRFALPFLPGGLCFFVLHHGDRFFLLRFSSAAEVGTYALGYKLAMTVAIFSLAPLFMVWSARMYEAAKAPDAPVVFGQMFSRILGVYALAGLGLCLFADEAIAILGGAAYGRAGLVVAPVLAGCLCQGAASLMDAGLYVRRRTGLKLGISLSATAVMLALYAWLIPLWGALGAALATLGGFALLALLTWAVTQRVFPVRYEWGRLAAGLAVVVVLWLAAQALPPGGWAVPLKAGLWLLAPLLLWAGGAVRAEEKQLVREALGRGLARARALLTPAREAGEAVAAGR
jgi:O-antigen/teichoic acid export membrane protein